MSFPTFLTLSNENTKVNIPQTNGRDIKNRSYKIESKKPISDKSLAKSYSIYEDFKKRVALDNQVKPISTVEPSNEPVEWVEISLK